MVTKTISLTEDAYHALARLRGPGESFSDVVRRLTRRRSLTELADIFDADAGQAIADAVALNRKERMIRRKQELGLE